MEEECWEIVESMYGRNTNKGISVTGVRQRGRVGCCCVFFAGVILLEGQGWTVRNQGEGSKEKHGFVLIVCGRCERRNGQVGER